MMDRADRLSEEVGTLCKKAGDQQHHHDGCFFAPMSNPEDGVDDALFAEPSIAKRLVPAMNGSRRERCQQYGGDETCAGGSGGEGPWKAELGREPATS